MIGCTIKAEEISEMNKSLDDFFSIIHGKTLAVIEASRDLK